MENEKRINKLENELFQLSQLKKEGKKVDPLIRKTENILFEAVDAELETHHHFKSWDKELHEGGKNG